MTYSIYSTFLLKWSRSARGNGKSLSPPASASLQSAREEKSIEEVREQNEKLNLSGGLLSLACGASLL